MEYKIIDATPEHAEYVLGWWTSEGWTLLTFQIDTRGHYIFIFNRPKE